jgi:hypothetical protein
MVPPPIALGLTLCEKVIVEEGTKNVTLVSTFTKLRVDQFPTGPQRFVVFAVLTDGLGDGTIELVITRLETDEAIYTYRNRLRFPDRLTEVRVLMRVNECSFPAPGRYQFTLLIDGDWLAQCHLQVAGKDS